MNKVVLIVFYDMVAKQYTAPMTFYNEDCAIRYFASSNTKNKRDYECFLIGYYSSDSGVIELCDKVKLALPGVNDEE